MTPYATIGSVEVYQLADGTIYYRAGLKIDADGSPHAAHPDGVSGLDSLANMRGALVRGPDGQPIIQGPRDRAPGYYLVGTALVSAAVKSDLVADRYVNSEIVPYGSLPPELLRRNGGPLRVGDLGWARCEATGRATWLIAADVGPHGRIGEGSIAAALALSIPADPRRGGCSSGVEWWWWPGSASSPRWPRSDAEAEARRRWAAMGR